MTSNRNELNGWNLDQFQSIVKMVKDNCEAGKIKFQTFSKWDTGFGVEGHTDEIGMIDRKLSRKFTLRGDHPQELLGMNTGPTAVETLFAALGSCICGTYAARNSKGNKD